MIFVPTLFESHPNKIQRNQTTKSLTDVPLLTTQSIYYYLLLSKNQKQKLVKKQQYLSPDKIGFVGILLSLEMKSSSKEKKQAGLKM